MSAPSGMSGIKFNKSRIIRYYSNDSPNNTRIDGGYITLAIQLDPLNLDQPQSKGWVTIWHIQTTIPHEPPKTGQKDPELPAQASNPIFVGELKMGWENEPLIINPQPLVQAIQVQKNAPQAMIRVPYIMIQEPYRGFHIAPILWLPTASTAEQNLTRQLTAWRQATQANAPNISKEPPVGVIVVDNPDFDIKAYWDKVGFNFLASQHDNAYWHFDDGIKRDVIAVLSGTASNQVRAQINPLFSIPTGQVKGAAEFIGDIAKDGIKRGNWSEVAEPQPTGGVKK